MSPPRRWMGAGLALLLWSACQDAAPPRLPTPTTSATQALPQAHAALCGPSLAESCRLLAHYSLAELEGEGMCQRCGVWCERPWPGPAGQLPCAMWGELERCIWQAAGTRSLPALAVVARDNVVELQRRADGAEGCVSGAP